MPFSVVIATRDRGPCVVSAVTSVLACEDPDTEVIVVDQSCDERTARSLDPLLGARVRYLRSRPGLSRARNVGWRAARHPLIAITDDDCVVSPDWLSMFELAFRMGPQVGLVFGNVWPPDPDQPSPGTLTLARPALTRSILTKHRVEGIANSMAVRKGVLEQLQGFDEMLGLGAPFQAGEEVDLCLRALHLGTWLYHTPAARVIHRGSATGCPRAYVRARLFGVGAAYAKQVRAGRLAVVPHLVLLAARILAGRPGVRLCGGTHRQARLQGFCQGFAAGLSTRLDRRGLFICSD